MRGIQFEIVWWDQDVVEYRVQCSNGSFSGDVKIYANHDDLGNAAETLSGFPVSPEDSRTVELGTFDAHAAGGGVRIEFFCADAAGHAIASVKMRDDGCRAMGEAQSACVLLPVEAGAIDSFVSQIRSTECATGANAFLLMADHTRDWVRTSLKRTRRI